MIAHVIYCDFLKTSFDAYSAVLPISMACFPL